MYLSWNEKTITDFSDANINTLYNEGYVFTRIGRGVMHQTRSVRVDLSKFDLSSENRRILRKTETITYTLSPIPYTQYDWMIGKMGKDFYETKFGDKVFSANKIKELMTDESKTNFNKVFVYNLSLRGVSEASDVAIFSSNKIASSPAASHNDSVGYCIALETNELVHYCYPFYNLEAPKDMGLGMMLQAILLVKENGKKYIYLGSAQRPTDTYKFQFSGAEWWDGKEWKSDAEELKNIIQNSNVKRQN